MQHQWAVASGDRPRPCVSGASSAHNGEESDAADSGVMTSVILCRASNLSCSASVGQPPLLLSPCTRPYSRSAMHTLAVHREICSVGYLFAKAHVHTTILEALGVVSRKSIEWPRRRRPPSSGSCPRRAPVSSTRSERQCVRMRKSENASATTILSPPSSPMHVEGKRTHPTPRHACLPPRPSRWRRLSRSVGALQDSIAVAAA